MTVLDDPQPKKTPTIEDCLALMKTAKGCGLHTIRFFKDASCDISAYDHILMGFDNLSHAYQWLTERQPSKTVTVEIDRTDAKNLLNDWNVALNNRVQDALTKALEA